jgi:hypothetical protein
VAAVPRISEAYLEPVLVMVLAQFPFVIHGFHSDNGSELINQTVARLLNKLMIEQTKSRPRHSKDLEGTKSAMPPPDSASHPCLPIEEGKFQR